MSLREEIRLNYRDFRHFGLSAIGRHFAMSRNDGLGFVSVPDIGPVCVRSGDSDMEVLRSVFVSRVYDLPEPAAARVEARYEAILKSGGKPIIVDAGANIGAASLWFGARFPEARLVAIEPDPTNVALLRRNLAGRSQCVVLEAAIGSQRGFASLQRESLSWGTRTIRASSGVPVVTVDDAFEASGGDTPFIVKIDIEGFEEDLFASNTQWIERCCVIAIEPHDWMLPGRRTSGPFQAEMSRHPFELFVQCENLIYVRI